jgi:integrase
MEGTMNLTQARTKTLCIPGPKECWYPDNKVTNLWLRVWPSGSAKWVLRYRADNIQRKLTLGGVDQLTVDAARKLATKRLAEIADGRDPTQERKAGRSAPTLSDLADLHLATKRSKCKPSTLRNYDILWRKHILTQLDARTRVRSLDHSRIVRFHAAMGGGANANRALEVLKVAFDLAVRSGWITANPAQYVEAGKENVRQWVLSPDEIRRLLTACDTWTATQRGPIALPYLVKLLLLSGRRVSEWTQRTWAELPEGSDRWHLADTKSGERFQFLSPDVLAVLDELRALNLSDRWVIPSTDPDKPLIWPHEHWVQLRHTAQLDGLRLHDLRHTAGSYAVLKGGLSQREVADVLGHKSLQSSARYVGQWDESGRRSAGRASAAVVSVLGDDTRIVTNE